MGEKRRNGRIMLRRNKKEKIEEINFAMLVAAT